MRVSIIRASIYLIMYYPNCSLSKDVDERWAQKHNFYAVHVPIQVHGPTASAWASI